ncbi:gas vesicle protein GvpJ [Frankia sp. CcWB2]
MVLSEDGMVAAMTELGEVPVPRGAVPGRGAVRGQGASVGRGAGTAQPIADLLDRLVDRGVVISGDVVVALAGVDLLRLDLRALLIGVQTAVEGGREAGW